MKITLGGGYDAVPQAVISHIRWPKLWGKVKIFQGEEGEKMIKVLTKKGKGPATATAIQLSKIEKLLGYLLTDAKM